MSRDFILLVIEELITKTAFEKCLEITESKGNNFFRAKKVKLISFFINNMSKRRESASKSLEKRKSF
jgi:hypothetical protein